MILQYLDIQLSPLEFSKEWQHPIEMHTRSLCGFLERQLRKKKVESQIKGIICIGTKQSKVGCGLSKINEKYLEIEIQFPFEEYKKLPLKKLNKFFNSAGGTSDEEFKKLLKTGFPDSEYRKLPIDQVNEFFIRFLMLGIEQCSKKFALPVDVLWQIIEEFRSNGYHNEWITKKRIIKGTTLKYAFHCCWTIAYFTVDIIVYKGKEEIFSDQVLYTWPSEYLFAKAYDRADLQGNNLIVIDKFGYEIYEKDLTEFI